MSRFGNELISQLNRFIQKLLAHCHIEKSTN